LRRPRSGERLCSPQLDLPQRRIFGGETGSFRNWRAKMSVFDDAVAVARSDDRLPLNVSLLVITGLAVISLGFVAAIVMSVRAVL
jgi:hypothetical protein